MVWSTFEEYFLEKLVYVFGLWTFFFLEISLCFYVFEFWVSFKNQLCFYIFGLEISFRVYALIFYSISTSEQLKVAMKEIFVPPYYKKEIFNTLHKLTQGDRNVEDYVQEMEVTLMKADVEETSMTAMQIFEWIK